MRSAERKEAMEQNYDLAIIGGGPAGYTAAIEAAKHGFKITYLHSLRKEYNITQRESQENLQKL